MADRWIYLVRHGEYDWDDNPHPRKGLTPRGRRQARLTARRLREIPATAVYSSDLARAKETAACICAGRDLICVIKRNLRECPPPLASRRRPAVRRGFARVAAAFDAHLRGARGREKHDIIVTHGNTIRYLVSRALTCSERRALGLLTLNCGITVIRVKPDGTMWLMTYNDVGHLPRALVTEGIPKKAAKVRAPSCGVISCGREGAWVERERT